MEDAWDCSTVVCNNTGSDIGVIWNDRRRFITFYLCSSILSATVAIIHICSKT